MRPASLPCRAMQYTAKVDEDFFKLVEGQLELFALLLAPNPATRNFPPCRVRTNGASCAGLIPRRF